MYSYIIELIPNYLDVDGLKGDTYTVSAVYKDAGGNAAADANAGS